MYLHISDVTFSQNGETCCGIYITSSTALAVYAYECTVIQLCNVKIFNINMGFRAMYSVFFHTVNCHQTKEIMDYYSLFLYILHDHCFDY